LNHKTDLEAWELCFNSYIRRIGLSTNYEDYLQNVKQRAELQLEYLLSNKAESGKLQKRDRNYLNEINRLTHLINEFIKQQSKNEHDSVMKHLNWLSKNEGRTIKIDDITTLQYFELIKEITKKTGSDGDEV
jgi:seryl-tRNA synthetase